jgi:DNA-binding NtrC family response regulator
VVEDDTALAQALETALSRRYRVVMVSDAPAAMAAVSEQHFDLVLLDLILPRGTGMEVLSALSHSVSEPPPALIMSALGGEVDLSQFQDIVVGELVKPFGLETCLKRIADVLAGRPQVAAGRPGSAASVLLVDDDAEFLQGMVDCLRRDGYAADAVATADDAIAALGQRRYDAVVTDWIMPGATGLQLVERIKALAPQMPVVLLTGFATPELTRHAMAAGASDVLVKPFPPRALPVVLEKALHPQGGPEKSAGAVPSRTQSARPSNGSTRYALTDIVGESVVMRRTKETLVRAAAIDSVVLIQGETGTGKELFAQALHLLSSRVQGPFVPVNAAAIPDTLLESELFGYAGGAFTGARKEGQKGRFLQAHGGTLFLDEIGDLPLTLQAKLLRVLQEGEIDLVGGGTRRIDVRVVAATHRNLEQMVAEGTFRSDLYYRLNVVTLYIPPLRVRPEDIAPLAKRFLTELGDRYGRHDLQFSSECLAVMQSYAWPGNVRELRNAVERGFAFAPGSLILPSDLPPAVQGNLHPPAAPSLQGPGAHDLGGLAGYERDAIVRALEETGGNKVQAARLLGISRAGLYVKLKIYGIK